jgi:hypothetical protein
MVVVIGADIELVAAAIIVVEGRGKAAEFEDNNRLEVG